MKPTELTPADSLAAACLRASRRPERSPGALATLASFWLIVALVAGTGAWLGGRVGDGPVRWISAVVVPLVAAVCWVPITVVALRLARRFPLVGSRAGASRQDGAADPEREGRVTRVRGAAAVVHLFAAAASSFSLNLAWSAGMAVLGRLDVAEIPATAMAGGLRWVHVNAGVYLAIVLGANLFRSAVGDVSGRGAHGPAPQRIRVGGAGRVAYVDVDSIDWIEGAGDYASIRAAGAEHLTSLRLKELERILDGRRFVRIHRSTIANVDRIRELRHLSHGDYRAELECGTELRVSRRRRESLTSALERRALGRQHASAPSREAAGD